VEIICAFCARVRVRVCCVCVLLCVVARVVARRGFETDASETDVVVSRVTRYHRAVVGALDEDLDAEIDFTGVVAAPLRPIKF